MMQHTTQLCHMPLSLVCLSNGLIAFIPHQQFSTVYEDTDDYKVLIDNDGISIVSDTLDSPIDLLYNEMHEWRDKPLLVKWLQSMNLQY